MNDRPASWRMPTSKQMEKLAAERLRAQQREITDRDGWWRSVLSDAALNRSDWIPIQQRRLAEIPRDVLRVKCLRCDHLVEIQKTDAIEKYGQHAIWKDVGQKLLDDACEIRTGRHEEDGCWPDFPNR